MEENKKKVTMLRRFIGLGILVGLALVIMAFASGSIRIFYVNSSSMMPAVYVGDFILVDGRHPVNPKRGHVVAVRNPAERNEWLCKRMIALPGDLVELRQGVFYLNGEKLEEDYVIHPRIRHRDHNAFRLEDDEYFVLGDNRSLSIDSLDFGPVKRDDLLGIVKGIYWPRSRARSFETE